ncbi:MAG: hypothetical protein JNK05_38315 [Myxococcales bacterium]|nr:hypothetical protein [Myxococcales bacterium]
MTFSQCHLRTLVGRLASTPGVVLDPEYSSISRGMLGCKKSVEKKLVEKYGAALSATLGQVAEAEIGFTATIDGHDGPIVGRLAIPSAATLLKQDFAWHAKNSSALAVAEGCEYALIDRHDDGSRAWLVRARDGAISVHVAEAGQQRPSRPFAADLDEYMQRGLSRWFVAGWLNDQDPKARAAVERAVDALKRVQIERTIRVEVIERAPLDDAAVEAFVATYLEHAKGWEKAMKARVKAIRKLGPIVRVRLHVMASPVEFLPNDRVASLLADAPGGERFLEACGASDPRFDWLWHHEYAHSIAPPEYLGSNYLEEVDFEGRQTEFTADCVLCASMVPGLEIGTKFVATKPYA